MKRMSSPLGAMKSHYDAIVVGSGYGGGVAASRLARMGYSVALLERGEELHPGEYPDTPIKAAAQAQIHGAGVRVGKGTELFDLRVGPDINVLLGCGLGGTSLINANVSLEADPRVFDDPVWPASLRGDALDEGYRRARAMLNPKPYPNGTSGWPQLNKLRAMEAAGGEFTSGAVRPPINVAFEDGYNPAGVWQPACNLCGDCCSGCNTGAKSTTLMNYIPDAHAFGAAIFCGIRVVRIEPRAAGGWTVVYETIGVGRERFDADEPSVSADIVVLAAGALGSTEILLRSRERGLTLSDRLGDRFSGNGDVLAFGYNNDQPIDGIGFGYKAAQYDWRRDPERPVGPTITGLIDLRGTPGLDDGMVIEEGAIPGGIGAFMPAAMALTAAGIGTDTDAGDLLSEKAREIESLARGPYHGAVANTQTFLVMSHDGAEGTMRLVEDRLCVDWPGVGDRPGFQNVAANIRTAVKATGGTYVPNPIWTKLFGHALATVHPLGGCVIGHDASSGGVDADCRVFAGPSGNGVHDGLFVCDGAVIPRSLGVNPLLTISAVAERAMIRLAAARGRTIDMSPAPRQPREDEAQATPGIRFTEKMAGTLSPPGGGEASPAAFVVTVVAPDVARLIADKQHEADLVGTVHLPGLSAQPLTVEGGRWNLFTEDADRIETRQMVYRMPLTAVDGSRFYFFGRKIVHDDPGFDLWSDTTTLVVDVHAGPDASGPILFQGKLTIAPKDFIRQIRTMAVTGTTDFKTRAQTLARFGAFFGGQLFQTFGGPFARPSLFDPAAVRAKRPLRLGTPEIHHFNTSDGKTLRLTRYKGGSKGPLILAHGLGVSSLIFAIDTIDTSLVEYVYAAGYDCWLLDYRASIELGYTHEQFTADDVADKDYPAAVAKVLELTGKPSVQFLGHCYGAMSFAMAMLGGLQGVRASVISQIASHADVPFFPQRLLAHLRGLDLMRLMGVKLLDARAATNRNGLARFIDVLLGFLYPYVRDNRTRSFTSRRITALYGQLYQLSQLNQGTLDAMPEMFGKSNIAAFRQLSRIARKGHVVRADGSDTYLTDANIANFAIPTLFIHGAENRAFSPSGTTRTMAALAKVNGEALYTRRVIPETGHIDCIFGKNAARDVFPAIVAHLDRTASV